MPTSNSGVSSCTSCVRGITLVVALIVSSFIATEVAMCEDDPIEILCTGHAGSMPYMAAMLKREPMTDAIIIPTRVTGGAAVTDPIIRRYMRLYFPRSYEELVEKYEFLILRGIDSYYFTSVQQEWMRKGFEEGGLGGLQDRSVMSSLGSYSIPWSETSTARAFPNEAESVVTVDYNRMGNLEVIINLDERLPPVLTPYKELLNLQYGYWSNSLMIPRLGSETYAWSKSAAFSEFAFPEPGQFPHVLGWRYGEGYTWSLQDYSLSGFWGEGENPYGPDAYFGMLMYSTGRQLPDDVVMVHQLRIRFHQYSEGKGFIFSLIEFVDKFGANTNPLEAKLGELDQGWRESRELYLAQEYDAASSTLLGLLDGIEVLRLDALRLKDRALYWIYLAEWFVVTGTFLVASFVIWSLMVRRRLYRQVATSRLARHER